MDEQKHAVEQKLEQKNREVQQNNKASVQKGQFFTMSLVVDDEASHTNAPVKNRSNDSGNNMLNPGGSLNLPFSDKNPQFPQLTNPYRQTNKEQQKQISHYAIYPPGYQPSGTQSLNLFNQKMVSPSSIFSNQMPFNTDFKRGSSFPYLNSSGRNDFIPSGINYFLTSKQVEKFASQRYSRDNLNNWSNERSEMSQMHPIHGIRLNVRSQVNRKTRKYQISTNNAHKKYINSLKNIFYEALSQQHILDFQQKYIDRKSSRAFFFIILVYVKYRFTKELGDAVRTGFEKQMSERIDEYQKQVDRCGDGPLRNYRADEIKEINVAKQAIKDFYAGNTYKAIENLYKKDRKIIVKQNHFLDSVKYIQKLEDEYSVIEDPKISKPCFKDHYHRRMKKFSVEQHSQKEYSQQYHNQKSNLSENYEKRPKLKQTIHPDQHNSEGQIASQNGIERKQKQIGKVQNARIMNDKQIDEQAEQDQSAQGEQIGKDRPIEGQHNMQEAEHERPSNEGSQLPLDEIVGKGYQNQRRGQQNRPDYPLNQEMMAQQQIQEILFPPIPPYFYLPNFDEKYGYLFRKLAYVKAWRETSQNQRLSYQHSLRNQPKFVTSVPTPAPLSFTKNSFFPVGRN